MPTLAVQSFSCVSREAPGLLSSERLAAVRGPLLQKNQLKVRDHVRVRVATQRFPRRGWGANGHPSIRMNTSGS